jgi:hypothetical protein
VTTFVDLLLNKKPRIYLSYHITGFKDFKDVKRFRTKLSSSFVCIDPFTIKDWSIVRAYDRTILSNSILPEKIDIPIPYEDQEQIFRDISLAEIEEAIDLIRTQIVQRDLQIIASGHGTVVYHNHVEPSYGVMAEIIHSGTVGAPVYVLYPFKTRPSPFFEQYINKRRERMVQGADSIENLEDIILAKMSSEYPKWLTWLGSKN